MLHQIKHCLLFPWKLLLLSRRRQILFVTVTVAALITTLLAGFDIKSLQGQGTRFPLTMAPTDDLASNSFDLFPTYEKGARALQTVVPPRQRDLTSSSSDHLPTYENGARELLTVVTPLQKNLTSSRFGRKRSSGQPAPHSDCKSWRTTSQHKTTLITKTVCRRQYFLLILVSSAPENFDRRDLIRQTWGAYDNFSPNWKTFFLLGKTRNHAQSDLIITESKKYGDVIHGNYYEHYWNQSLKIQMAFQWAARYCSFSFLLKTDDDVFVNTRRLIDVLRLKSTPKKGLYMGKVNHNPIVQRGKGKWRVSYIEYSGKYYPNFCSGGGFVMSYDVIECLVPLFDVVKRYRIDDVYVGMLAKKSGVTPVDHSGFVMPFRNYDECNVVPNTLVQHQALGDCLTTLFRVHSKG
ncbi:beta-1,3-galactosyltransferase 1-like [Orbicella faveolata]|uniref:beta-1,3-galactosyltransferase 1-like n=1 Tax=Orbicella faveolata TaxID=48498 RepID=UPI0009E5CE85|nr:beta-1,3-galactosyltransferase 1-like [Orbicella faveolata]